MAKKPTQKLTSNVGAPVADNVTACERIPAGHKVAVRAIGQGEEIRRYGQIIGFATQPIAPGQHVHTHNLVSVRGAVQR